MDEFHARLRRKRSGKPGEGGSSSSDSFSEEEDEGEKMHEMRVGPEYQVCSLTRSLGRRYPLSLSVSPPPPTVSLSLCVPAGPSLPLSFRMPRRRGRV